MAYKLKVSPFKENNGVRSGRGQASVYQQNLFVVKTCVAMGTANYCEIVLAMRKRKTFLIRKSIYC